MNRRDFLGYSTSAALAAATPMVGQARAAVATTGKPNFLFIIADDLTYRAIQSVNNPEVHTPNMDKLAQRGCVFSHCFHQGSWIGAVCVASRTMLNTGLTAFKAQHAIPPDKAMTTPAWGETLRKGGYDTFITGKWHLDAVTLQRSFSQQGPVGPGYLPSTPDMYRRPAPGNTWNAANTALKGHWLDKKEWLAPPQTGIQHSSELYADAAVQYLGTAVRNSTKPFFMYVAFNAPHDPRQAPQSYLDMYPVEKIQVPPNFLPDFPLKDGHRQGRDENLAPFPRTPYDIQVHRREYYAIITHMDAQIGRIFAALEQTGRSKDTYVILTADHGLSVGEHGLMGKQNQFDCSTRMPLMIAGPGVRAGKHVDEMVYQHCMFATTCDLAGIPIPPHVEFPSLVPMLYSEAPQPIYESVFAWMRSNQRSLRTRRHKIIFYPPLKVTQVFDLQEDPWEMHDLANDPASAQLKADLYEQLVRKQKELGDPLLTDPTAAAVKT